MAGQKIIRAHMRLLDDVGEQEIFDKITEGYTTKQIYSTYKIGSRGFYKWLRSVEGRNDRYQEARQRAADFYADEILSIADSDMSPAEANIAKLRIDSRKWWASRVRPERWGDKKPPSLQITLGDMHLDALKEMSVIEHEDDPELISVDDSVGTVGDEDAVGGDDVTKD